VYYDIHLLPPEAGDDPQAAIVAAAAHRLAGPHGQEQHSRSEPPAVDPAVLERVRSAWVRPGEGLRIEDGDGALTVRLPYWYVGKQAHVQAKVLHRVVKELEQATGRRGYDPQLADWFTGRDAADTAAVLDAVADFQAREGMDSPAVDARRAARAAASRTPRLPWGRRRP
jgi:hypothetical protein